MPLSIFLKIDGISGEATAAGHAGEIMLQSFTWGSSAGTAPTGAGAGKISFQNAIVTKVVDKASPPLFHALTSAQHVPQCIVTVGTIVLALSTCLIESISEVFEADAPAPLETIVISFAKVELQYTPTESNRLCTCNGRLGHNDQFNRLSAPALDCLWLRIRSARRFGTQMGPRMN